MKAVDSTLLLKCQRVSYRLFEDLLQLQNHPHVKDSSNEVDTFISLVNRRVLTEHDPGENDGISRKELICEFVFDESGDYQPLIVKAEKFLEIFDKYSPALSRVRMPPPVWLRLLPVCLEVTKSLGLWGTEAGKSTLRFMSFALEPLENNKNDPYEPFVNINSDEPRPKITGWEFAEGLVSHSLNRALFGSFYDKRLESIGWQLPYVWWGIRFRTSGRKRQPYASPDEHFNWLDVYVDQEQFKGQLDFDDKNIIPVSAEVEFPQPLPDEVKQGLENLFRGWAFYHEYGRDTGKRKSVPLDTPSKQIFAYVRLNQRSFRNKKLPERGMDCLICPGVFWSASPLLWGTGMTTVYGFEGFLEEDLSDLLLSLTQQLMIGPTVYSQVNKIWLNAERAGRHNLLHELPGYMDAIGMTIKDYEEQRVAFLEKYPQVPPEEVPPLPRTDDVDVMVMLLAAENRELRELPSDLATELGNEWTEEFLSEFVERLVWTPVLGDIRSHKDVIKAMEAEKFSIKDLASKKGAFQKPRLKLETRLHPKLTHGLYPLFLLTLKSAFYHAYLHSIINNQKGLAGLITLAYKDDGRAQYIEVRNSGAPPDPSSSNQLGWKRNIDLFKDISNGWNVKTIKSEGQFFKCSVWYSEEWDDFDGYWLTTLCRSYERGPDGTGF